MLLLLQRNFPGQISWRQFAYWCKIPPSVKEIKEDAPILRREGSMKISNVLTVCSAPDYHPDCELPPNMLLNWDYLCWFPHILSTVIDWEMSEIMKADIACCGDLRQVC